MVKHCCVCKLQNGMKADISFHSIPKDNELQKKWIFFIGREVSKSSTVCSQHFKEKDISYKVIGDSVKRFLSSTAVPCINLQCQSNSENVFSNNDIFESCSIQSVSVSVLSDIKNQNVTENLNSTTRTISNVEYHLNDISICSTSNTSEEANDIFQAKLLAENIEHNVDSQSNNTRYIEKLPLKRKSSVATSLSSAKRISNPRYMGDLRREDFVSDMGWNIVQKYYEDSKRKEKTLNQKIKRLNVKIENLKELLDHVKKLGLLSSERYNVLEVSQ